MTNNKSLSERARDFAAIVHTGHVRKYSNEPYFLHLEEVANLVRATGASEATVAAAYLHDTVEDVGVTLTEILTKFGPRVTKLVNALTDDPVVEGGPNRAARKENTRRRLMAADKDAHTIKYADMLSNGASIFERDPGFAPRYHAEMRALLAVLNKGNAELRAKVEAMLNERNNRRADNERT